MKPLVSVIMAAYNAEKHISEAIESVLSQTLINLELIIVNDGSSDTTQQIVEDFSKKDPRVILHNNVRNLFVIKSRNIGIEMAKGKYLAILDSDDIALPYRFEKQYNYLEEHSDVFLLGTSAIVIDKDGNYLKDYISITGAKLIKEKISKDNIIYHSSAMFRNSSIFYREKMLFSEDYDFMLNLISENKVLNNLPDKLIKYRIIDTSLSRKNNKLIQWLFINKAREFYFERIKTGTDSYDSFNPDEYLKIEDLNYTSSKNDLLMVMKLCLYKKDLSKLRFFLQKYKKNYPLTKASLFYSIISINKLIFNLSCQLYSKL